MKGSKEDLIKYRLKRAKDTYEDSQILAERQNVNRLYYSAFYAVMALLLHSDLSPTTHNGTQSNFSEHFIKTGRIPIGFGKSYSQLFAWRLKGDYADLFDFEGERVMPYFEPVKQLIDLIEGMVTV